MDRAGLGDLRVHGSVEDHLASAPAAFAVTRGPTHEMVYANAAFRELLSANEIALHHDSGDGSQSAVDLIPLLDRVFRSAEALREEILDDPAKGGARWSCTIWPVSDQGAGPDELMIEVRDIGRDERFKARQRTITERLLLGALHDQDVARDAEGTSRRAVHVADVSRDLSLSLDEGATRDTIRRLTLRRRGTWCIVDVIEANGEIVRLPPIHPDPAKQALAASLADRSPADGSAGLSLGSVLASARPMIVTPDSDSALTVVARGEESRRILREIGFGALLVVPLVVRARVEGAITFVSPEGEGSFSAEEIALATDLGSRCAMALDNARLYREAETLRQAADLANQSKSQFLGSMSHELRTPLNAISGFVELLDLGIPGPVNERQHAALGRIKVNQELLLTLITEILNFARIESGHIEYHMGDVPIFGLLTEAAEMLSGAMTDKGLKLEGPTGDSTAVAWADADRVRQILVNLVMNAIKYTPEKGTISLACAVDGNNVIVQIADTGPGIPTPKLATIFEPFVQVTAGLADHRGGVGLGLTISRDLARAMNGDITVESTVGVGSRFTLSLPTHAPRGDKSERRQGRAKAATSPQ